MIKLATCFSGIGAIEHALNRMGIDNELVFACDNGDVDVLSKEVKLDIEEMDREFKELEKVIKEIDHDEYRDELEKELLRDDELFQNQKKSLELVDLSIKDILLDLFNKVDDMEDVKKARKKEYKEFSTTLKKCHNEVNLRLYGLSYAIEVLNDFHKDNSWGTLSKKDIEFKSNDNIIWRSVIDSIIELKTIVDDINGRKVIKNTRDICERLGMLHEKILTLDIHDELSKLETYDQRKEYVDSLYKSKASQNKVKQSYLANYELDERHFHWNVSFIDGNEYKRPSRFICW